MCDPAQFNHSRSQVCTQNIARVTDCSTGIKTVHPPLDALLSEKAPFGMTYGRGRMGGITRVS